MKGRKWTLASSQWGGGEKYTEKTKEKRLMFFHVPCFEGLSLTGLIVIPVFACADKGDYTVSVGCTITVKFNPKASCTASFWLSDFL